MTHEYFLNLWETCLEFNIEQKPEEFKQLLDLLETQKSKRWALEIGSNYGGTTRALCEIFDNVVTIDIKAHENFERLRQEFPGYQYFISDSTSNRTVDLINSLGVKFDFIFIDGDHSYKVAKSDWEKYKNFCADGGLVAFHDTVLSDENRRLGIEVDILWSELREQYSEVYDFISPSREFIYPTENEFHRIVSAIPYDKWGGIGVVRFQPVAVFVHNYLANNWQYVVRDQLDGLVASGLYKRADKIHYGVYGESTADLDAFRRIVSSFDEDSKISVCEYTDNEFEYTTLEHLQAYCCANRSAKVLYYHTKGTSREFDYKIDSWRKCMEYFNIEKWNDSLEMLEDSEVCGALYEEEYRIFFGDSREDLVLKNYFSGNFWWARADYVSGLPNITRIKSEGGDRTACELWLGMGSHRWTSIYRINTSNYYLNYFDPTTYRIF
jgi:predicted O-methyltransferase YrrM